MHKKILSTMLVLFFVVTAVYSAEDPCEGKEVCLQKGLPGSAEKIEELYSLNIGRIGYLEIGERSEDLSLSAGAIYEAGRTAKELALLRAQYEGIGKEELIVEHRIITTGEETAEDAPDFTEEDFTEIEIDEEDTTETDIDQDYSEEEPETSIESASIWLNDGSLFSRDYFIRFKNNRWEWCKDPVFGGCINRRFEPDDKKFKSVDFPSKDEAEGFYEILSELETADTDYESGLIIILKKLLFLRYADSEIILEINGKKVDIVLDAAKPSERFEIIIGDKKAYVSGVDSVRDFIALKEPFRPQFENIFQEFKKLATNTETKVTQRRETAQERERIPGRFVNITSENSGKTGAEICSVIPATMPTKAMECDKKVIIIDPNDYATKRIYSCEAFARSPETFETAFDAVFCES